MLALISTAVRYPSVYAAYDVAYVPFNRSMLTSVTIARHAWSQPTSAATSSQISTSRIFKSCRRSSSISQRGIIVSCTHSSRRSGVSSSSYRFDNNPTHCLIAAHGLEASRKTRQACSTSMTCLTSDLSTYVIHLNILSILALLMLATLLRTGHQ